MLFIVKADLKDQIVNFDSLIIKTGMLGTLGNKGSCLIRFNYLDTSIALSTGHFAAGSSSNQSRLSELNDILNKNFPMYKKNTFKDHDAYIIFGDLNFRCEIDFQSCLDLIKLNKLDALAETDQFIRIKHTYHNFNTIKEGKLDFAPTYKFVIGSSEYDGKKKRVPSWCDRIFYKRCQYIRQINYNRAELSYSDHKPVYSLLKVCAIKEFREEKAKLVKEIKANMMLGKQNSLVYGNSNFENLINIHDKEKDIHDYFK
jgi:hypothetical protein